MCRGVGRGRNTFLGKCKMAQPLKGWRDRWLGLGCSQDQRPCTQGDVIWWVV